jgi:hypothetical protein
MISSARFYAHGELIASKFWCSAEENWVVHAFSC